jgi:L-threonine kinase
VKRGSGRPTDPSAQALTISPADRTKALAAFEMLSAELGLSSVGLAIDITSNIPVAKGHASSTADILAVALLCIQDAYPATPPPVAHALALSVARRLEYGDYLLHPGIASCAQRSQTLIAKYHTDLRWSIVGVDEGGWVRTEEFHREIPEDPGKARVYAQLFGELDAALLTNDGEAAADIATRSAELHNDRLPKKSLEDLMAVKNESGALGICVAHSGTLAGLIFSKHQTDHDFRVAESRRVLRSLGYDSGLYTLKESRR